MATDDTSVFNWTHRDANRLYEAGGRKALIPERQRAFWRMYHNDFEGADLAITEAIQAAQAESETAWELFLRHWRVQLRLKEDLRRALPEAIDLLTLAEDQRVRDVPQRICSFHDVVYCHLAMDPTCYGEDTLANSESVLAQVPGHWDCADCARMNSATALAALGRKEEAQSALARFHANQNGYDASWLTGETHVYLLLEQWEDAERIARQAIERTRKSQVADEYTQAHIYLARALIERGQLDAAGEALMECRRMTKYAGGSYLLAQLLEMDGRLAIAMGESGADYLTRAAERYFALGRYREAAVAGLLAAERARNYAPPRREGADGSESAPAERPNPEPALAIAAQALGSVRTADPKLAARLAAFGRVPTPPAAQDTSYAAPVSGGVREGLEAELEAHLANGNPRGVATALYRLGTWLTQHEQPRAAVDYLILNGVMERALRLRHSDREDALLMLTEAGKSLPQGVIEAAFAAMERSAPERYAVFFGQMPPGRWRWLVRAVAAEWRGEAVVEPEDYEEEDREQAFMSWLDHTASMTALVLRFRERADPAGVARWIRSLHEIVEESKESTGGEPNPLTAFAQALAALCEGEDPERALALAQPPFVDTVRQVIELAHHPAWEHPGNSPLDYFIERDAQMAVRALRAHDERSATRRQNMAFRFELQAMDLREAKSGADVARFLVALAETVRAEGVIPSSASELPEEFQQVLAAVSKAGSETGKAQE
jgi:tetratricopeptide (TPR) repeat protein